MTDLSKLGFTEPQRKLAERMGERNDGALAVRLRFKMVEARTTQSNGDIDLTVRAPDTLPADEGKQWTASFFGESFPGMEDHIRIDEVKDGKLGVHLTGPAATRYTIMMQNLNLAEESIEKDSPSRA